MSQFKENSSLLRLRFKIPHRHVSFIRSVFNRPCPCFRYSFEGVLQAVYGGDRDPLACKEPTVRGGCVFVEGSDVLKTLDVKDAKFYVDFIVLCVFFVVLRLGCYIVLRWRVKVH